MQLRSDRKFLTILFAAEKFYKYTYPGNVLVQSDHTPLGTIFSKPVHTAPKRLWRMLLRLQRYDLHLTYQHGTDVHIADMLSRAYLEGKPSACALQLQDVEHTDDLSTSLERLEAIKSATAIDAVFQSNYEVVEHGWPHERSMLKPELYPSVHIPDEIQFRMACYSRLTECWFLPP